MLSTKKTSALTSKTLLSGIAGISLVLGMSLAPVSFDFQGGQLEFKSIAAYASPGDNESDNEKPATSESDSEKPSASDIADKARELADKAGNSHGNDTADKAGNSHGSDTADKAGNSHDSDTADKAGQEKDSSNDAGSVTPDAAPLALSEFISSMRKGTSVTSGAATTSSLNLSYANGWKEEVVNGRYVLVDPNGNTIVNRAVRTADIARLRSILK